MDLAAYIKKHWRYDPDTGEVFGARGKPIGVRQQGYLVAFPVLDGRPRNVRLHRAAWLLATGAWPDGPVDHVNGNRADNRLANLRLVGARGNSENLQRAHADKASCRLLGAYRSKQKWQALIRVQGRLKHLGMFSTAEEAHAAYVEAKRTLHKACTI